jgi:Sec-independent protein translocase protein TatA
VFDLTPEKLLLVGVLAVVVLGPSRLPQAARSLGRLMAQLRRMSAEFQGEVHSAFGEPIQILQDATSAWGPGSVRAKLTDALSPPALGPENSGSPRLKAIDGGASKRPSLKAPDDPSLN